MKDEIKEILSLLNSSSWSNEAKQIEDYITNLQEKNNNLQEDFKRHIDRINELTKRSDNLQAENKRLNNLVSKYDKELKHKTEQYEYLRHYNNSDSIINEIDRKLCSTWQLYYDHSRLTTFKCEDMLYLIEQIRKDIEKN